MKTPIIKYSDKFLNSISWFMKIGGISLYPWIVLREIYKNDPRYKDIHTTTINHESIHIAQQKEMLVVIFYIWYLTEWFLKLFIYGKRAYYNISFEREAYSNESDLNYLGKRKHFSWFKRIFR